MMIVRTLNSSAAACFLVASACANQSASTDTGVSPVTAVAAQEPATPALPVAPEHVDKMGTFVNGIPKRAAVHTSEPAFGPDKVKHFFISAFVETMGFGLLQAVGAGRNAAMAGAVGATVAAGVGRELYDRRTKGEFSVADLVWDAAGAGAALLVISRTQR